MKAKAQLVLDIECFTDYFLVTMLAGDGRCIEFEQYEGHPLDTATVQRLLDNRHVEFVTFNGNNYDMPMLSLALRGVSNMALKSASDDIICNNLKPWEFSRKYPCVEIKPNHIDLIEVAPGMASLKIYGGRLHTSKMQDLPIEPSELVGDRHAMVRDYCRNDCRNTQELMSALIGQVDLRRTMSDELGVDVRSKSDAQIAEAVLAERIEKLTGVRPRKWGISYKKFKYVAPEHISFYSDELNHVLQVLTSADMVIRDTGHVEMPKAIEALDIRIGGTKYKIGIGGIHSQESEVSHYADEDTYLRDIDVRSYYPNLMLNMGMYPDAMGPHFLTAYRDILVERLAAKDAGDKVKDAVLKITLNGTFGKTSNQYSILYNPKMMIHTTLTGQLSLLMLIEGFEKMGISVVSANTDGIVVKTSRKNERLQRAIVQRWEKIANLETEETDYKSIHSRDVNSYIAIKTDGQVKTKGFFALPKSARDRLAKNPQNEICVEAVIAKLTNGTPVEVTVRDCRDITKFLTVRTVNGGAIKGDKVLGKAIRWYYGRGEGGTINYRTDGKLVARSEGAVPLMDLPGEFPDNVDFDWYIRECNELLMDIGVEQRPPKPKLPRRNSKAWKALVAQGAVNPENNELLVDVVKLNKILSELT